MTRPFLAARHAVLVGALIACITMAPGCSLFIKKEQQISIRASDPAARIIVDNKDMGTGPLTVMLDRTKTHTITARTAAGRSGSAPINRKISGYGYADIIGGVFLLVPLLGLLGPGFWELEPEHVVVPIE